MIYEDVRHTQRCKNLRDVFFCNLTLHGALVTQKLPYTRAAL